MTNQNLNYQQSLLQQPQYLHYYSPQSTIMHPPPNTGMPQSKTFLINLSIFLAPSYMVQAPRYNQFYSQNIMNGSTTIVTIL